ncbi:unnamed protein product [Arabidopsis halleri]
MFKFPEQILNWPEFNSSVFKFYYFHSVTCLLVYFTNFHRIFVFEAKLFLLK